MLTLRAKSLTSSPPNPPGAAPPPPWAGHLRSRFLVPNSLANHVHICGKCLFLRQAFRFVWQRRDSKSANTFNVAGCPRRHAHQKLLFPQGFSYTPRYWAPLLDCHMQRIRIVFCRSAESCRPASALAECTHRGINDSCI